MAQGTMVYFVNMYARAQRSRDLSSQVTLPGPANPTTTTETMIVYQTVILRSFIKIWNGLVLCITLVGELTYLFNKAKTN